MPHLTDRFNREQRAEFARAAAQRYGTSDVLIKARGSEPALSKGYEAVVREGGDEESPILTYAITTDAIDRDNDIVDPTGIDIRNYALNSPILWSHDHQIPNIGRGRGARLSKKTATGHRGILMDVEFHLQTDLSRDLYQMARRGFLQAGSIGFLPLEWKEEDAEDYEGAYPYVDTVRTYTKWELLEFSLCNVPMNPTAVQQGGVERDIRRAIEEGVIDNDSQVIALVGGSRSIEIGKTTTSPDNPTPESMKDTTPTPETDAPEVDAPETEETKSLADELLGTETGEAIAAEHEAILSAIAEAITLFEEDEDPSGIEAVPTIYSASGETVRAILAAALGIEAEEEEEEEEEPMDEVDEEETEEEAVSLALETVTRSLAALKEKKGAVLSKRNLEALTEAASLLEGVIAQAEPEEDAKSTARIDGLDIAKEIRELREENRRMSRTIARLAVEEITDEDDDAPLASIFG